MWSTPLPWRRARPLLFTLLLLLVLLPVAHAQGPGPSVATTMQSVKSIAVALLRLGMAVGTVFALVKVTKNFLDGNPNAFSSFLWLIGGVFVFFLWGSFYRDGLGTWSASNSSAGTIGNSQLNLGVSTGAYMMAQKVLDIMLETVVPLLLFTTVAVTVIRGFISSGSVMFEWGPIFRVVFMYLMLQNYNNVVPLIGDLIGGLAGRINTSTASTSAYTVLSTLRQADEDASKANAGTAPVKPGDAGSGNTDEPGLLAGLANKIGEEMSTALAVFSPQNFVTGLATDFMTSIIQAIMEFIQSFLLGFLYVSGPIALSFSLLPGFGGLAKGWLQSLIGIHMWSIAFQVIAGLFVYYQSADAALSYSSPGAAVATVTGVAHVKFLVGCIVFIIMYIMVPYMSSLIVGSSAADGFIGSAVRIASTMAKGAATGGAGAVATAGAGASAVNSLGAGASAMKQAGAFTAGASNHVGQAMGMGQGGSLNAINTMLSGGGSVPMMSGAGNQSSQQSAARSPDSQAPVPQYTSAPATPSVAAPPAPAPTPSTGGGGSSAPAVAAPAAAPAAAPTMPSAGGTSRGFGANVPAAPAVAAPPTAPVAGQALPTLSGGRPN